MYLFVSYDIVDDRIRTRVMKFLKDYGEHVQLSVFQCEIDEKMYLRMKEGIDRLIDHRCDRVRFYSVCRACLDGAVICGFGEIPENEGFELI